MSLRRRVVLLLLFMSSAMWSAASTQTSDAPTTVRAVRATEAIIIDGKLTEAAWNRDGVSNFKQRDPEEGQPESERTVVWVAFDDGALYVAARLYDSSPDSIVTTLGRRDSYIPADWFGVYVDPYYDRRNGFVFALSAAGTMLDGTLYNDDWEDWSWDGVWEGRVLIDETGWVVEMRIPFSQLRFHDKSEHVWGINFTRHIGRKNEEAYLVYRPKKESGFVSRFVDLVGIEAITPPQRIEILPYVNTRAEYKQQAAGDPFNSGSRYLPGIGSDFKMGIGSNLTLDLTVNPDFGQVEVDPAVVNLSDVETFFQEKRPFFVEGANTFRFGRGGATNYWSFNWAEPSLFYSRRIGRAPQGRAPSADYMDIPVGANILGAGKLTGKILDGWNFGTIHAVTSREFARLQTGGVRSEAEVEPLAYYTITRAQRDFNDGKQGIGFVGTFTQRFFDDQRLRDQINNNALITGIDGWTFLDEEKTYVVTGWVAGSRVTGTPARMTSLQRSSLHYFQRPDATHISVDSSASSLTGYAARFMLNKQKGSMNLNSAIGIIDPGFNSNDLGFIFRTDYINAHVAGGYKWTDPTDYYRFISFNTALFASYDFEGNPTWGGWWIGTNYELPNYYFVWANFAYNPETVNNRRTRGGPLTLNLPGREFGGGWSSDSRKAVVVNMFGSTYRSGNSSNYSTELGVQWKPAANLTLRVGPSYSANESPSQWVGAFDDPTATATFGRRYVFADFKQRTLAANIRLNWTFTPQLSLQLFAQPLISSGEYTGFKELARPKSYDFLRYGEQGSTFDAETFVADPDGPAGPANPIALWNPDFNYKSLRGNAVLRWEYRPGSTLFLVWTQSRSDVENVGTFRFNRSVERLWDSKPDNILMLKFSYWWSL
jgi:hypothetical protein